MSRKQETIAFFAETFTATQKLTDAQFGALMRSAFAYRFKGEEYHGSDPAVSIAFEFVASQLDRYQEISNVRSLAAQSKRSTEGQVPGNAVHDQQKGAKDAAGSKSEQTQQTSAPILSSPILSNPDPISISVDTTKQSKRFVPPTVEEVRAYCREKGHQIDAERFVNYYTSVGWKVGKNPMKNWKAAANNWSERSCRSGEAEIQIYEAVGREL